MSKKAIYVGTAAALVALLASTQVAIVAIGDESAGHTALVLRNESVSTLRFLDSTQAQCKNFKVGFVTRYMCEGRLAIIIADQNLALLRLPFSRSISDLTTAFWPRTE